MSDIQYKIPLYVLHYAVLLIESIIWLVLYFNSKFKEFISSVYDKHKKNVAEYIQLHKFYLKKIPAHLVIILGTELPSFEALSNVIYWGMSAGVNYISLYDHKGILKDRHAEFQNYVSSQKTTPGVVAFNTIESKANDGNGFKEVVKVNFFAPASGKQEIGELCKQLGRDIEEGKLKLDDITVDLVDKRLNEALARIPDPDLAVYTGNVCCTYGFLPWQIRLTEFLPLKNQANFLLQDFLNVLYKYAKKEQRFGR